MAERRRFLIASDHLLMQMVKAVSRALEAVKLLEAAGLDKLIVAARVESPEPPPISSSSVRMAGMNVLNGLLLVGVLPEFM